MRDTLRFLVLFVGWMVISLSATTVSANTSTLKCNSNKDQVWVYDSLTNFDIEAKLSCGETVEIIERLRDYVRIRTRNGIEGYVPDSQISDPPVFNDPTPDVGSVAKQVQAREIAKAAETKSTFIAPDAEPRVSPSLALETTTGPADKTANSKKPRVGGPIIPNATLADLNRVPSSDAVKKTSPNASAETPALQAILPSSKTLESSSVATPEDSSSGANDIAARSAVAASDADENPDLKLNSEAEDPACQSYFSAYGLTSSQLKWIVQNRKKMFPSVCPALGPSEVNFVFIFTHDVDFFSTTMPEPVHNINGFSDFRAMTTVDAALVSANKAHREYVWIFQFANGDFDPDTFSQHRRYQFSKVESNSLGSGAGPKAVEDAFRFVVATSR
ncbi:MAG TPA: hypothetical protein VEZ90_09555 [Blastocatellia bacterium]|nr:hypothetical protein [Blastocatellia bacterium]